MNKQVYHISVVCTEQQLDEIIIAIQKANIGIEDYGIEIEENID